MDKVEDSANNLKFPDRISICSSGADCGSLMDFIGTLKAGFLISFLFWVF